MADKKAGIIYLVRCDGEKYYKIGVSRNLLKRITDIEHDCPFYIVLLFWAYTPDPFQVERDLHTQYANKRIKGEWYRLTRKDVEDIRRLLRNVAERYGNQLKS